MDTGGKPEAWPSAAAHQHVNRDRIRLRLDPQRHELDEFAYADVTFEGYDPHPAIKAPIAV